MKNQLEICLSKRAVGFLQVIQMPAFLIGNLRMPTNTLKLLKTRLFNRHKLKFSLRVPY